jgi:threonine dehydratase
VAALRWCAVPCRAVPCQALAWSGRGRGLDVTVVASRFAPAAKLDRIRALDARLSCGSNVDIDAYHRWVGRMSS